MDIIAPATITVLGGGAGESSLGGLPPYGIVVTDPVAGDVVTVTVVAGNGTAVLSASAAGGAALVSNGNTLTVTGYASVVSAALSSLQIAEPANALNDTLIVSATDPALLPGKTAIAVVVTASTGPAFAAPPNFESVRPNAVTAIPGLALGDPAATGLAAMGRGQSEALQITLNVAAGVLLLPGFSALGGISVAGIGTGTITLDFTADQLSAVNVLLAGLSYAGPGQTSLRYAMTDVSGPLGAASTSGYIGLQAVGTAGINGSFALGYEELVLGAATIGAGHTLAVTTVFTELGGGIAGGGAVTIAAGAALEVPYDGLSLSGTSYDFGGLSAGGFDEAGSVIIADGAGFAGMVSVTANGLVDFAGTLIADATAQSAYVGAVSLGGNAIMSGDGALLAGNFSAAGVITGPGTIIAGGGDILLISAGSITGGAHLDAAAGGVLVLGPVAPLYGVFNATPVTIDSSVTLAFIGAAGAAPVTGVYADNLDEDGGVIVISGPQVFGGTITGFTPGDRLVFPGLSGLTILNITPQSFVVAGNDSSNVTQHYTINAVLPAGAVPVVGVDAQGDSEIELRPPANEIFINGALAASGGFDASVGVMQPVIGLEVLLRSWTAQSLTLTLSVGNGVLADGGAGAESLVLTAANPTALNTLLAALSYTANLAASQDALTISSSTGYLNGFSGVVPIAIVPGGTTTGFGKSPSAEQTAVFAGSAGISTLLTQAAAPGVIIVENAVDFADVLTVNGISGTALLVDAGGIAVFDAGNSVALGSNVTIGDAGGAGTLGVVTANFVIGGSGSSANLVVAASSLAAGSVVEISGGVTVDGDLVVGSAAAARLDVSGYLDAVGTTIGLTGTLIGTGGAVAAFGGLVASGLVVLAGDAQASASNLILNGVLDLGGTAQLAVLTTAVIGGAGLLAVGPDASFSAGGLTEIGGGIDIQGEFGVAGNFAADAAVTLGGGMLTAVAATLAAGAVLSGYGDVVVGGAAFSKIVLAGGDMVAIGGLLVVAGDVTMSGGGSISIGISAGLDLVHAVGGGAIVFNGADAELTLNDVALVSAAVSGMVAGDVIDLVGVAPGQVSFAPGMVSGTVSVTDVSGVALGAFALGVAAGQPAVEIVSDGNAGALITLGGDMPCFARGTRLLTPNGYCPVEAFSPGDPIITHAGDRRAVRWIGRRTLDLSGKNAAGLRPVVVMANALAPGQPSRPVRLSPLHALFLDGVLVPVMHLVNGATIIREATMQAGRSAVTYYHIELDRHDIVMADGMAAESYLDTGNRGQLYREAGKRGSATKACAPLITKGPLLAKIRRCLHEIALTAGFTLVYDPGLRGLVNGGKVLPKVTMQGGERVARFALPPAANSLLLLAQAGPPADTDPESEDRRQLGICVNTNALKGRDRAGTRLGAGWYDRASGDAGVWMGAAGEVFVTPGRAGLTLRLAAVVQSWRPPVNLSRLT